jgi:hypothetical protein
MSAAVEAQAGYYSGGRPRAEGAGCPPRETAEGGAALPPARSAIGSPANLGVDGEIIYAAPAASSSMARRRLGSILMPGPIVEDSDTALT